MTGSSWQWLGGAVLGAYILVRIFYVVHKHRGEGYWTQTIFKRNRAFWLVSLLVIFTLLTVIALVLHQAMQPGPVE
ncbi:MAG: hypothetical protein ACRETA_12395 [Gammaproteobacteria bacterium]